MSDSMEALTETVRGRVITASDPDDDARAVHNGMHDRRRHAVDQCRAAENCGANYEWASAVKTAYDPENLFHMNRDVAPAKPR